MQHIAFALILWYGFFGFLQTRETLDLEQRTKEIRSALSQGKQDRALELARQAVEQDPQDARARLLRGTVYESLARHREAVADFDKAITLDPKLAEAYNHRGSEQFKLGLIQDAVKDYDRFLELQPREKSGHWRRGIALYYAGRYEEGRKQFEGYEQVDTNDVENSVWCFLCAARQSSPEKAKDALLKIGRDGRVPMMTVYALFAGKAKPEDVLTAANNGKPSAAELKERLFYAHLYLGLYYEAMADPAQSARHIRQAVHDYAIGHYMWDVARVHEQLRTKKPGH